MELAKVERYVGDLMTVSGVEKEGKEQNVGLALYHLLMSAAIHDLMSNDEKELFRLLTKKLQYFFCTRLSLKERKETKKKKNFPPNPLIKEKAKKETEEKMCICVGDADLEAFRKECLGYLGQYDQQLVANFFNYFTQRDANGMMHFQNEPYWDTGKRLALWVNNPISAASTAAAQRMQKQKSRQDKQQVVAQERNEANDRLWQQYADMKKGAVSHEEYLRMKEKEHESHE